MATNTTKRPVDLGDIEYLYAVQHISSEASAKKLYRVKLTAESGNILLKHKELTYYSYLDNLAYKLCQIDCSIETRVNILQYYAQQFLVNSLRNAKDGYNLSEEELYSKENYDIVCANVDKAIYEAKQRLFEEEKPKVMVYKEDVGIPWNTKYNYPQLDLPILGSAIYPTLDIYTNKYYVNMDKLFGLESSKKTSSGNTTNSKLSDEELVECFNWKNIATHIVEDSVLYNYRNLDMGMNEAFPNVDFFSRHYYTNTDKQLVDKDNSCVQSTKHTQLQSELASFDKILAVCAEEYQAKAVKYGNSLDDMQLSTLADLLLAKSYRVYSFLANSKELLVNESIANDLRAIINYAIVSLIKIRDITGKLETGLGLSDYEVIAKAAQVLMKLKNADYDQAWKQFAISSLADLIKVKVIRVKNMLANSDYSSLADNYYDIINYAAFTLIRLEDK